MLLNRAQVQIAHQLLDFQPNHGYDISIYRLCVHFGVTKIDPRAVA